MAVPALIVCKARFVAPPHFRSRRGYRTQCAGAWLNPTQHSKSARPISGSLIGTLCGTGSKNCGFQKERCKGPTGRAGITPRDVRVFHFGINVGRQSSRVCFIFHQQFIRTQTQTASEATAQQFRSEMSYWVKSARETDRSARCSLWHRKRPMGWSGACIRSGALSARPRDRRLRGILTFQVGHYVCAALATLLAAHKRGTVAQEGDTRPSVNEWIGRIRCNTF